MVGFSSLQKEVTVQPLSRYISGVFGVYGIDRQTNITHEHCHPKTEL